MVHIASPGPPKQAIEASQNIMQASLDARVKRVVMTSSTAAVQNAMQPNIKPADCTYNESHWTQPDSKGRLPMLPKSKVGLEKTAWDFIESLQDQHKFELVTICPGFVMGPMLG